MKILLLLLTTLISNTAFAWESPNDVTELEVSFYQLGMERGCKDAGRRKGDAVEQVDSFCNCMISILKEDITYPEWQQASFFASNKKSSEERKIIGSHMGKVQGCRNNAP